MDFIAVFIAIIVPITVPIAAGIGASLSIYNTYQNWKNTKPDIKIQFDYKLIYKSESWPNDDTIQEAYETIIVTNRGMRTITLAHGYIQDYVGFLQLFLERVHLKKHNAIRQVEILIPKTG